MLIGYEIVTLQGVRLGYLKDVLLNLTKDPSKMYLEDIKTSDQLKTRLKLYTDNLKKIINKETVGTPVYPICESVRRRYYLNYNSKNLKIKPRYQSQIN